MGRVEVCNSRTGVGGDGRLGSYNSRFQLGNSAPMGHWAISGDICSCRSALVIGIVGSQRCCSIPTSVQDDTPPPEIDLVPCQPHEGETLVEPPGLGLGARAELDVGTVAAH